MKIMHDSEADRKARKMNTVKYKVQGALSNPYGKGTACNGTYRIGCDDGDLEYTYEDLVAVLPGWVIEMVYRGRRDEIQLAIEALMPPLVRANSEYHRKQPFKGSFDYFKEKEKEKEEIIKRETYLKGFDHGVWQQAVECAEKHGDHDEYPFHLQDWQKEEMKQWGEMIND